MLWNILNNLGNKKKNSYKNLNLKKINAYREKIKWSNIFYYNTI